MRLGEISVTRTSYGQTVAEAQKVEVPIFHTDPAEVEISGGISRELPDKTWVKVAVSVRLPCYPEASEIERAGQFASDTVERLITREMVNAGIIPPDAPADPQS